MPFALAAYSALMYIYMNPCCAFCKLCYFRCSYKENDLNCNSSSSAVIIDNSGNTQQVNGDNLCGMHKTSILKVFLLCV